MGSRVPVLVSFATAALIGAAPPLSAQTPPPSTTQQAAPPQPAAPKPYKAVAVTPPTALEDPSFAAFRKQLGTAADKKDRKALAAMIAANFFWMGEKGDKADKRKPGIDNLSKAIELDGKEAEGWDILVAYAADPTAMPFPDRKDTVCAPADPGFDGKAFEDLVKSTGTDIGEWAFPVQPNIEMRAAPQPNAAVVETLGMNFVRVLQDDAAAGSDNADSPMLRVVAPSGKIGYVPIDALSPTGNDQLCYSKEAGGWKISGVIDGGP
jgi:hypothetical protein